MDFNQIRYFLAVIESQNFSRAAADVYISQSSLSKQIKSLENELGAPLLHRSNTRVWLTQAGKDFLPFAKKIYKEHTEMQLHMSQHHGKSENSVCMGTLSVMSAYKIAGRLSRFLEENKDIHIKLVEDEQKPLLRMLMDQQLDLAIIRTDFLSMEQYDALPIMREKLVMICHEKHSLANRTSLYLSELSKENFITFDETCGIYHLFYKSCLKAGFTPHIKFRLSYHESLLGLVAENLGIILIPRNLVDLKVYPQIRCIALKDNIETITALVKHKGNSSSQGANRIFRYFLDYPPAATD